MHRHRFGGRHLVKQGTDLRQWRQHHVHDHSFLCALKPGGNAEPFVGDEESLSVGWFDLDDLPLPGGQHERAAGAVPYLHREQKTRRRHALFQFDGQQY